MSVLRNAVSWVKRTSGQKNELSPGIAERRNRMRILLLSVTNPVPANNGVKMRTWAIVRALRSAGHDITLLAFAGATNDHIHPDLAKVCKDVFLVPHTFKSLSSSKDYLYRAKQMVCLLPHGAEGSRSRQMAAQLDELLRRRAIDVIVSEQSDLLINLPDNLALPLIHSPRS